MKIEIKEFFSFRRMFTPTLIKTVFWLLLAAVWLVGLIDLIELKFLTGFITLTLGTVVLRIFCESLILFFQMNHTLSEILATLKEKPIA